MFSIKISPNTSVSGSLRRLWAKQSNKIFLKMKLLTCKRLNKRDKCMITAIPAQFYWLRSLTAAASLGPIPTEGLRETLERRHYGCGGFPSITRKSLVLNERMSSCGHWGWMTILRFVWDPLKVPERRWQLPAGRHRLYTLRMGHITQLPADDQSSAASPVRQSK